VDTYKYYEVKIGLGDLFAVNKISITDNTILYFWGLFANDKSATWGCPIGLYRNAKKGTGAVVLTAVNTAAKL